jgi:2-polyprenyl-3-methyl-5-hydroxy-6-metoxy-1,4-benzoquinol methylase
MQCGEQASFAAHHPSHGISQESPRASYVEQESCPGCASTNWTEFGSSVQAFAIRICDGEIWQPSFRARRCNECHLVFKSAVASEAVFQEYYKRVDFRKWEIPGLFPTEERVLAAVRSLPAGSRVLDFGCSTGRLLSALVGAYQCFGYDVNASAARLAASKGITLVSDEALFRQTEQYDAVLLVDVYEHLTSPTALLRQLSALIRPGGRLVICTGNAGASAVRGDPATFWYFQTVEHVVMLTRRHADFLASTIGLDLVQWEPACHYHVALGPWLREWSRSASYDLFHTSRAPWLRSVFRMMPVLRRAERWTSRPARVLTKDHVVAVFAKS